MKDGEERKLREGSGMKMSDENEEGNVWEGNEGENE